MFTVLSTFITGPLTLFIAKYWKYVLGFIIVAALFFYIYLDYKATQQLQDDIQEGIELNARLSAKIELLVKANQSISTAYDNLQTDVNEAQTKAYTIAAEASTLRISLNSTNKKLDTMRDRDATLISKPAWTADLITKSYQTHLDSLACATGNKDKC